MELGSLFEKTRSISKLVFFIPFTIILFFFAVILSPFLTQGFVETEGTVVASEDASFVDAEGHEQAQYNVTVTYTVDGKTYQSDYLFIDDKTPGSKVTVYYDPKDPNKSSNSKNNAWLWIVFIVLGVISAGATVYFGVKDHKRHKQTKALREKRDAVARGEAVEPVGAGNFNVEMKEGEQTEYYFRFDGHAFKPGYLIEDKDRKPLFEGKMLKNNPLGAREFEFVNHRTGETTAHKVGHVVTSGDESMGMLSTNSYFKFDGVNVWDFLHDNGVLIDNAIGYKLGQMVYTITVNGSFLAKAVMTSNYVHEEDEEKHKVNIINKMYYRIWTNAVDLELIFTVIFAVAETNQAVYS